MQPIYHKWQVVPTITTVETTNYPIWNIHFPAVTICSNNKVVMTQFNRIFLGDHWKNMSNSDPYFKDDLLLALTLTLSNDNEEDTFENENQRERVKEVIERYKDHMTSLIKAVRFLFIPLYYHSLDLLTNWAILNFRSCLHALTCLFIVSGKEKLLTAKTCLEYGIQIMDTAVHLIHSKWLSDCNSQTNSSKLTKYSEK